MISVRIDLSKFCHRLPTSLGLQKYNSFCLGPEVYTSHIMRNSEDRFSHDGAHIYIFTVGKNIIQLCPFQLFCHNTPVHKLQ